MERMLGASRPERHVFSDLMFWRVFSSQTTSASLGLVVVWREDQNIRKKRRQKSTKWCRPRRAGKNVGVPVTTKDSRWNGLCLLFHRPRVFPTVVKEPTSGLQPFFPTFILSFAPWAHSFSLSLVGSGKRPGQEPVRLLRHSLPQKTNPEENVGEDKDEGFLNLIEESH